MLETINKLPTQLQKLDKELRELAQTPSFSKAQDVIGAVIGLLGFDVKDQWKLFADTQGKIRSNAGWFMMADGYADKRASYIVADSNPNNIDLKAFWMKTLNKSIISWLGALTPNFEDEPFYGKQNIGIDFVIPEKANKVLIVLSKNHVMRAVELQGYLSVTQQEIFSHWIQSFDFTNKAQVHDALWKSFDLEPVNKSFYKGISEFFVELRQFLTEDIKIFDSKHAAYFTNRLIGRIVFCWFLDKKGIINPEKKYFDVGTHDSTSYYHAKLEELFFKVLNTPLDERDFGIDDKTPFLNGGLFEIKQHDNYGDDTLSFPKDYFDRFFTFLRHYNFTTDESTSTFQQVAIDPEMLGRIFENLLAEQVEETGEQARKAKGAFYTPREIVDYMCKESLRVYLRTKIQEDEQRDQKIGLLLDVKPHEFRDQQRNYRRDLQNYKYDVLKALDEVKILDPACGSGAFPIGMMHLLLDVYDRIDATFNSYKKKIEIIKNNLFGVDIEPMAVEICRLRAWLSIVVDEEADSEKIEPLPNLDFKFICANSLIPLEKEDNAELFDTVNKEDLLEIRDKYFNARTIKSKEQWQRKYEKLIEYKKGENMFSSVREKQLKSYHPFDSESVSAFYDPEFMFGINKGVDLVIGNPPYRILTKNNTNEALLRIYSTYYNSLKGAYSKNIFTLFIERSIYLIKKDGILSFIVPEGLFKTRSYSQCVDFMNKNGHPIFIASFTDYVFDNAITGNIVFAYSKGAVGDTNYYHFDKNYNLAQVEKTENTVLNTIKANTTQLSSIATIFKGMVVKDRGNIISTECKGKKNVFLLGKCINRWFIKSELYTNYSELEIIGGTKRIAKYDHFPRILIRRTGDRLCCALLTKKALTESTLYSCWMNDDTLAIEYLIALMNSKLLNYYNKEMFITNQQGFPQILMTDLGQLPIKVIDKKDQLPFIQLVNQIMLNESNQQNVELLEAKLNELIYILYGLSPTERKIVLESK